MTLTRTIATPAVEKSAAELNVPSGGEVDMSLHFEDPDSLLAFVTENWRERWVTTDIWEENVAEVFSRRPFFLLISVDAPVTVRWERFKNRFDSSDVSNCF